MHQNMFNKDIAVGSQRRSVFSQRKSSAEDQLTSFLQSRALSDRSVTEQLKEGVTVPQEAMLNAADQYDWEEYASVNKKIKDMNAKVDREVTVLKKTWYRTKKKHFMIASSNVHKVDPEFQSSLPRIR